MPIFLKANHQLESRMPEIGQSGSEGGAKITFVPTPIINTLDGKCAEIFRGHPFYEAPDIGPMLRRLLERPDLKLSS